MNANQVELAEQHLISPYDIRSKRMLNTAQTTGGTAASSGPAATSSSVSASNPAGRVSTSLTGLSLTIVEEGVQLPADNPLDEDDSEPKK